MTKPMPAAAPMVVRSFPDRPAMGRAAAAEVADALRGLLKDRRTVRMVFAAAPSQQEMLDALCEEPGIDWARVTAFHMDEYVGLAPDAPQRFGAWLRYPPCVDTGDAWLGTVDTWLVSCH